MSKGKTKAQLELELQAAQTQIAELQRRLEQVPTTADAHSVQRFQQLLELLPVGVSILNRAGAVVFENPALQNILGLNTAQLREGAYSRRRYLAADGSPMPLEGFASRRAQQTGTAVYDVETGVIKEDGETIWLNVSAVPVDFSDWKTVLVTTDITGRKQAEVRMREAEALYRALFESSLDGLSVFDAHMNIQLSNQRAADIYGFETPEAMVGINALNLIQPEEIPHAMEAARSRQAGAVHYDEFRLRRRDGTEFWGETASLVIHDQGGNPSGTVVGSVRDITERKQAEQQRHLLSERLRLATRSAQMGIWDWDIQKNELVWDEQMYALYGLKPGLFGGAYEAWLSGIHPNDRAASDRVSAQAVRGEREYNTEFRVVWPDGAVHWIKANGTVFRDEQGMPLRMVGINYDITERKQAETALQESEQRYTLLFQKSSTPLFLAQLPAAKFADANEAAEKLTGYTRAEMIGRNAAELGLVSPKQRADTVKEFEKEKTLVENEMQITTKTGEERWIVFNITQLFIGGQPFAITSMQDITERKLAEIALRQSEQKYSALFEKSAVPAALTKMPEAVFVDVNESFQSTYGYSREEVLGKTSLEIGMARPDEHAQTEVSLQKFSTLLNSEKHLFTKSGQARIATINISKVLIDHQDYVITTIHDVTERKQAEAALRQSQQNFIGAFEANPAGLAITRRADGRFIRINPAYSALMGYSAAELVGHTVAEFSIYVHPAERQQLLQQLADHGSVHNYELAVHKQGGIVRDILVSMEPIRYDEEDCILSAFIDVTERHQAEERLAYQATLLANVSDAIIGTDAELHITYWNQAAEEIFGWKAEEVAGKSTAEVLQTQFFNSSRAETLRGLMETGQYDGEVRYIRKTGEYFDAHARSVVLNNTQGNFAGLVTSIRDITQRKQLEAQLHESEQRYTLLFQKSTTPVLLVKLPAVIIADANEAAEKLTGYLREEMVGKNAAELGLISHTQRTATIARFEHDRTLAENEMRISTKSGAERIVIINTNPLEIASQPFAITSMQDITERKQAEQALREQAERLREQAQLLEHAHVLIRDMDNRIVTWNLGMQQLYGWREQEALGQVSHTFFQTQFPQSREAYESELLQRGQWEGELIHLRKDGRHVIVASHHTLFRDAENQPMLILEVNNDITQLKAAEESLRLSEERLRLSLQAANQGLYDLNTQTGEAIVNDEYALMLGYDPATFHETNALWIERLHPDDQARAAQVYSDYVAGKLPEYRIEFRQRMRSGEWKWILSMGKILEWDAQGQPLRMLGTHSDIDQRKRTEQALLASQKLLQDVIDNTSALVYIVDAEGRFLLLNHKLETLFGVETGTLIGQTRHTIMPEAFATQHRNNDLEIFSTGHGKIFEEENQEADGRHVYLTTKFPLLDEQNQIYAVCGISTDMTDRKLMEEELRRSNAELEQFAYVASHDLQEPLRAVAGMVHLLGQRYQGQLDERADEYIGHAIEAASRMQALITDLLTYSRVERRTKPIEPVATETCLQTALKNLNVMIHETRAVITHDPLPVVDADASQLAQLLQNLIGNGIKFRGEREPQLHISVMKLEDAWQFAVRDNGIGIESEYFERIFLVFQRLHTRREYPGTGIGLAICKKIVERHGGQLWVESTPGAGSTFYFTLPIRNKTYDHELITETH